MMTQFEKVHPNIGNVDKNLLAKYTSSIAELKKIIGHNINGKLKNVCAWCRSEYDGQNGMPIRKLSDDEYRQVKSHGVCRACSDKIKKETNNGEK